MINIFIHIPKAAGTTFNSILNRNFTKKEILKFPHHKYQNIEFIKEEFQKKDISQVKIISGHMKFGLHRELKLNHFSYVTMLRNPLERMVSHYYYVLKHPTHYLHSEAKNLSLEEYILSDISDEHQNAQTKYLAGNDAGTNLKILTKAKQNIEDHFSFVGLSEEFDLSLFELKPILGLKRIIYKKRNVNSHSKNLIISPEAESLFKERNELDYELYGYCRDKFFGIKKFSNRVKFKSFVFLNGIYQGLG
jgi:hypothetical protein